MEYEDEETEEEDLGAEFDLEDLELSEEEIEALLEIETAAGTEAGTEAGGEGQAFGSVVTSAYDPYSSTTTAGEGDSTTFAGGDFTESDDDGGDDDDSTVIETTTSTTSETLTVEQDETEENEPVSFNVLEDSEDSTLVEATVTESEETHEGELTFESEGTITYTPTEGEEGTVVVDYTVEDSEGTTTDSQLSVTLAPDSEPTIETTDSTGTEVEGYVTATGTITTDFGADTEGSTVELSAEDATWYPGGSLTALDGSWVVNLSGDTYTFTQYDTIAEAEETTPGETYDVDVTVTATDSDGDVATGTFTVTLTDDGPTASDVVLTQETEDTTVTYNVLTSGDAETGAYGGELTGATLAEESGSGEVSFNTDGTIVYEPTPGETGTVLIDYTVTDSDGDSTSAQLSIGLAEDSEPVITVTDSSGEVSEDVMSATGTLSVDFGADNDDTTVELAAEGATWYGETGTLIADDGSWAIEVDEDSYEYTQFEALAGATETQAGEELDVNVTVTATDGDGSVTSGGFTVTVTDDGPIASDATIDQETEDTTVSYNVLTGGEATTGLYGGALIGAALADGSDHEGEVSFNEDGTITYEPVQGETGTVLINYTVSDSDGDTASAQLSIGLTDDSEPTIEVTGASGDEADSYATASGSLDVSFGADAEGASIELSSDTAEWDSESRTLAAEDGSWDIVLTEGGYDFTQYEAFDHSEGDSYAIDVTVTATDGDGSVTTGDFTVLVSDDGPVASDATFTQETEDTVVSYNVITEGDADLGVDGGTLTAAALTDDSDFEGEVGFDEDGTITYDPAPGETGTVLIDYTVTDGDGDTASAQLSISLADDSEPEITATGVSGDETDGLTTASGSFTIDFGGDSEDASYELSAEGATWDGESQTLTANDESWSIEVSAGSYTFTQNAPFTHSDSTDPDDVYGIDVGITAIDGDGSTASGSFTVTINDDGPTASDVNLTQAEFGTTVSHNVFTEGDADTGLDGGALTAASLSDGSDYSGEVTFTEDGEVTYTPAEGESGTVTIDYTVTDNDGDSVTEQLNVTLAEEPDDSSGSNEATRQEDTLTGSSGDDTIDGLQAKDVIFGGGGDDSLEGSQGDDTLYGEEGDDTMDGGTGDDELYGGSGNDYLYGDKGDDILTGGTGDDTLEGGKGNDTFVFTSLDDGEDTILDFKSANDQIQLYESTFDLSSDSDGHIDEDLFVKVDDLGDDYDFGDSSSGLVYTDSGENIGSLFYDPDYGVEGDETLIATISEDDGVDLEAEDIDIV